MRPEEKDVMSREEKAAALAKSMLSGGFGFHKVTEYDCRLLAEQFSALRAQLTAALEAQRKEERERNALLGNDEAVHLGALAAVTALQSVEQIRSERDAARAEADQLRNDLIATKVALSSMEARWLDNLALKAPEVSEALKTSADLTIQRDDLWMRLIKMGHTVSYGKDGRLAVDGKTLPEVVEAEKRPALEELGPAI